MRAAAATVAAALPVLVDVSNYWRCDYEDGQPRRQVSVVTPAGELQTRYILDSNPALVRFLNRQAGVAA